jgi:adenosylcobinamide kinase / adenosylcobinamide-phosphate guanylyltransferase
MAKQVIFITGGCRSGKSRFALEYANRYFSDKCYLATCEPLDEEMARRIENHKRSRGPEWETIEEPIEIADRMLRRSADPGVILLDCVTLWISNLLMKGGDDENLLNEIDKMGSAIQAARGSVIVVSNEVGMGIVPADALSRRFRDLAGMANQRLAGLADAAICMVSGIPLILKGHL